MYPFGDFVLQLSFAGYGDTYTYSASPEQPIAWRYIIRVEGLWPCVLQKVHGSYYPNYTNMDSPLRSPPNYHQRHSSEQQYGNVQPLPDLSGRRPIVSSYHQNLPLFSSSEGYSLPFLDHSTQTLGFLPFQPLGNSMMQPPVSLSPTLGVAQDIPYSGMSLRSDNQPHHIKGAAWLPRQVISVVNPQVEHAVPQIQANGKTDVDTLMKAIQQTDADPANVNLQMARVSSSAPASTQSATAATSKESGGSQGSRLKKKYQCHLPSCAKRFFQKTHLEIHMRAHTGYKPFVS